MTRCLKARARLRRLRERERALLFIVIAEAAGGLAQISRDPWSVLAVSELAEEMAQRRRADRQLRVLAAQARRLNIPLPDAFVEAARKEIHAYAYFPR